jgi:pyroglutamyl-peptidase
VESLPKVLLTAFEPFAGAKLNASAEVAAWIKSQAMADLVIEVLPVEYQRSVEVALALIAKHDPEIVIGLGQAEGRSKVSFERVAVNLDDAKIADNSGEMRRERAIIEGGDAAFMANFPVRAVVGALQEKEFPVEESLSAGAFVCNHLFYGVMSHLKESGSKRWMEFIHLPLVSEQAADFPGKPVIEKQLQGRAIIAAIEEARKLWK